MKTIVMAGGFGTRLRPLTINVPKPMVAIGNLPMMEHVLSLLVKHGLTDVGSLLYFHPDHIRRYFRDGADFGVKMNYFLPDDDLGTAGAVKYAVGETDQPFLVISGDVLTNFDLSEALRWHKEREADATILLTRVENPIAYGIVITDENGLITQFLEKPTWGEAFSDTINTGIYILEPSAARLIPPGENFDFSQDLFPLMLKKGMRLFGKVTDGYWKDVGNIDEYRRAHYDLLAGDLTLDLKSGRRQTDKAVVYEGKNVRIGHDVMLSGTVILGNDVVIEPGVSLQNCAIGHRSRIGTGCDFNDTVIWPGAQIGNECRLSHTLVCANVRVGRNVQMLDDVVVSDDCTIGDSATIKANCKIWPGKSVDEGAIVSSSLVWGDKWNRELVTESKISGLALTEITPEMAVKLGAAFGATLGVGTSVVSSRDASDVTRLLRRGLMSGLMASGVNVYDLETMPVPVVRYALSKGKYAAGIYVRHHPTDYRILDFIFFHGSAMDMPKATLKKLERNYFGEDFERADLHNIGHLEYPQRVLRDYQVDFMTEVDIEVIREAGFKIVVDYSHGSASEVFPNLYSSLGISTTELNSHPNPLKSCVSREEDAQGIVQLSTIVRSLHCDIGIRINPASEKMTVVDEDGIPIDNQTLLLIFTELFLEAHRPTKIAVPVAASMGVEEIAQRYGAAVERVPNDHQAMMHVHNSGAVEFVGGTRGGVLMSRFQRGSDALFTSVKLLELLARTRTTAGRMRKQFEHYVRQTVSVPCPWSRKGTVMRRLITDSVDKRRELIDGVRIFESGGWVLVTPDRSNAAFDIQAESTSREVTESLVERYRGLVESAQEV